MEAQEYVRYRASVTSLAKGGWTVDATVEIQQAYGPAGLSLDIEPIVLARLRSFVDKLRAEYPPQVETK